MDIEIKDYLNPDEIKEICKDALYQKVREDMRGLNINDIIANISHADVEAMVDTYVGEDAEWRIINERSMDLSKMRQG